jgi:negative regulator of sigma-B (phosphoserine phosphatase)
MGQVDSTLIEWGAAASALPGQAVSGDRSVVAPFPGGVLVAVADGLGHGSEASLAAEIAAATLEKYAAESVIALVQRCHEALLRTRGVVLSLASFNGQDNTMTWMGVGNVEGVLFRADAKASPPRETILLRGGTVGYRLPPLRASVLPVAPGDTLIFVSDGIRSSFVEDLALAASSLAPQQIADGILIRHGRQTDDALVLVVRYLGGVV